MSLRRFTTLGAAAALASIAIAAGSTAGSAAVTVTSCPAHFLSSRVTASVLAVCGVRRYRFAAVTRLPGGGREVSYNTPGPRMATLIPPAGFNPLEAPAAERAIYGIPPEPPASQPGERSMWISMMQRFHPMHATAYVYTAGRHTSFAPTASAAGCVPNAKHPSNTDHRNQNWAGYIADEQGAGCATSNYFHYVQGFIEEPPELRSVCRNTSAGFWGGLGGFGKGPLGQAGTSIGANDWGFPQNGAWFQTDAPGGNPPYSAGISATTNQFFYIRVSHPGGPGGTYNYFFDNYWSGAEKDWVVSNVPDYDGSTAEWIAEKVGRYPLANFGNPSVLFDNVSVASQENPIPDYPYVDASPWSPSDGLYLATPDPLTNGGFDFSIRQNHCA